MGKGKKKKKALTGLAAALVSSGHMKEKQARKVTREQRRDDKALGREGVAQREAERAQAESERKAKEAETNRQRAEQERVQAASQSEERGLEKARAIVREHHEASRGRRRWFFVARDRRVLFLELSDAAAGMLVQGQAAIVESLGQAQGSHAVLVGEPNVERLSAVDPDCVRFYNRGGAEERPPRRF